MTVRIITGDCRLELPKIAHADAMITDPVWPNCPPGLLAGSDRPMELFAEAMALLPTMVKRVVVILRSDSDPRFLQAVPSKWPFVCTQALSYAVPMYLGRVLGGTELAYCYGEPITFRKGRQVIPMWGPKAQPRARPPNGHPCSRAMVHMEWLVDWWSEPGETVLDPFCGSGTIPLAAESLHRHGIGIEIEPKYSNIAMRRADRHAPQMAVSN